MRLRDKLTETFIATATKPGRYGDGGGLELQVSKWGTKSWLFRYMRRGKASWMGLGGYPTIGLLAARQKAADARLELSSGIDPLTNKRNRELSVVKARRAALQQLSDERRRTKKAVYRRALERASFEALKELKIVES